MRSQFSYKTAPQVEETSRSGLWTRLAAMLAIIGLGAGGWLLLTNQQRDPENKVVTAAPGPAAVKVAPAKTAAAPPAEAAPPAPANPSPPSAESPAPPAAEATREQVAALDTKLQQVPLWSLIKRQFPDWYGEQTRLAAKLSGAAWPESAVDLHLAKALVELRRKHANDALAASPGKLKLVATAFLDNLKALRQQSPVACYSFISQGETAPAVVEMMQKPEASASIHAQVAAIFEAIAEGRKAPQTHQPAVKEDYDTLIKELAKLGWQEQDLQLFSNPKALAKAPPERVCQMVQDWFVAHLSIDDQASQDRLLFETLKPVVSG